MSDRDIQEIIRDEVVRLNAAHKDAVEEGNRLFAEIGRLQGELGYLRRRAYSLQEKRRLLEDYLAVGEPLAGSPP